MPNGKTHDIITLVITPVVAYGTYHFTNDYKITGIILIAYLFASFMFNGDLDTNSAPYNRWWLLKMIWIPYQEMFYHRSIFSHGLIIGTIIRVIYVGLIPFLIIYFTNGNNIFTNINWNLVLILSIGLEAGSAIHTITDKIF